jgi:hypothetical protein
VDDDNRAMGVMDALLADGPEREAREPAVAARSDELRSGLELWSSSLPRFRRRQSAAEDVREDDGVVVFRVVGGVDEGESPLSCPSPELG